MLVVEKKRKKKKVRMMDALEISRNGKRMVQERKGTKKEKEKGWNDGVD